MKYQPRVCRTFLTWLENGSRPAIAVPGKPFSDRFVRAFLLALMCGLPTIWGLNAREFPSNKQLATESLGNDQSSPPDHPLINPDGIAGTLIIVGGGQVPNVALQYLAQALPEQKSMVVITAASNDRAAAGERARQLLQQAEVSQLVVAPELDDRADESRRLAGLIGQAGGVWICGGQQSRLAERYLDTDVPRELERLLARGGIIGGTSAGAAIMSSVMIESGRDSPTLSRGFDLLPNAIIDQHFAERKRLTRSRIAVAKHPGRFGLGIDEDTAVILRGRTIRVVGRGQATVLLGPCNYRKAEEMNVPQGEVADLVQIQRAAFSRLENQDPGRPKLGDPIVANGSLVIVGGGGMPKDVVNRFVQLAGGKDAHIVCLPTAGSRLAARRAKIPGFLADAEVASLTMLPQIGIDEVSVEHFQAALKRATGVWFGGGRQWNFIDAYDGSNAEQLFQGVLARGGVIGGSSAGATIQGEFLVRGHPLGNTIMMAEGYERGYAFLPGVAIDQHFSQRGRQPDLIPVIQRHPELLGIGIDEATALVVQGSQAEVLGKHAVHFLSRRTTADDEYVTVKSGETIDLKIFSKP